MSEVQSYAVNFSLGSHELTVDAESEEQAVARATDLLLERCYLVVGQATIDVRESGEPGLEL